MNTQTHTGFRLLIDVPALHILKRFVGSVLLALLLWQHVGIGTIAFAVTPEDALLQVEVQVDDLPISSSSSSSKTSEAMMPAFSASLISMDQPEEASGSGAEVPTTDESAPVEVMQETAAPVEQPSQEIIPDVPENTHPTFDIEKQAEIQSTDELEQRLVVTLTSPSGKTVDANVTVTEEQGQYILTLEPPANFEPGKYHIEATLDTNRGATRALQRLYRIFFESDTGEQTLFSQDFTWGVLAFNPDHASYLPGETAQIHMAVLDDGGRTLCDARVSLSVTGPSGTERIFATENGGVVINPDCKDKDVTYVPDYSASVLLERTGTYIVEMQAITKNGTRTMTQEITVVESRLLDVYRSSATRIYPLADYEMKLSVTPSHSFIGSITETVPNALTITQTDPPAAFIDSDEESGLTTITWGDRLWEAGTVYDLRYDYNPPDISPEFYLTGPVRAEGTIMRPLDAPVPAEEPVISLLEEEAMTGAMLHGSADEEETGVSPFFDDVRSSGSVVPGFEDVTASASTGSYIPFSSSSSDSASGNVLLDDSASGTSLFSSSSSDSASGNVLPDDSASGTSLSSSAITSSEESSSPQILEEVPGASSPSSPTEEPAPSDVLPEPSAQSSFLSWIASILSDRSYAEEGFDELHYEEPRQWQIASDAVITLTGKVFAENGTTPLGAGKTVSVSLSGSTVVGSDTTDAGGEYTITGLNVTDGMVVSVYLDGETEKAVTVTLGSGSNMTGVNLIQNNLVIRNDSHVAAVTVSHVKVAATNGDTDIASIVAIASDSGIKIAAGKSITITTGTTFRPGGYVRSGSGITIRGSLNMQSNPVNLSGSWLTLGAGSFTGTNTVTFDGSNASFTQFIESNTSTFSGVTILGNNGKTATLNDALRLSGSLVLHGFTYFNANSKAIRVKRDVTFSNNGLTGGASLWTVGGNWSIPIGYAGFTQGTAIVLTGSGQIFEGGGMNYGNITVQGVAVMSGTTVIQDTSNTALTVNTGATLEVNTNGVGVSFYSSQLRILQNATVRGDGHIFMNSGSSIPIQRGTYSLFGLSIAGNLGGSSPRLAPAKYDAGYTTIASSSFAQERIRFGTGTTTFGGYVYIAGVFSGSTLLFDTQTYNATVVFTGETQQFAQEEGGAVTCLCGTNPIIFSGSTAQTFYPSNVSFRNIAVNKTAESVSVVNSGSGQNITLSGGTLNIDPFVTFRTTRTTTVNASTTLSISTGASLLLVGDNADLKVHTNGLITGSGVLNIGSGASISTMSGTIRNYTLSIGGNHTGAGNRIVAGKYNAAGTVIYTTDASTSFEFSAGTTTFNGSLYFNSTGGTMHIRNDVTNPNLIVKGTMTTCAAYPACRGKINWQKGTGVLTFTGGFIHTLQMSGASLENMTIDKTNGYLTLVGTGSTSSMTVSRGEFRQSQGSLWDINGALTINRTSPTVFGQYSMSGGTLTLSGNLINTNGVFRATTGSVVLDGGNQTLSGSNAFYNLRKTVTTQKTLTFAANKLQSVSGSLVLRGISGALLSIRSTVSGQQGQINLETIGGQQTIDHLNVQDSYARGKRLDCFIGIQYGEGCINSNRNTNWNFGEITGTSRAMGEGTSLGNQTIRYSINGGPVVDTFQVGSSDFQFTVSGATLTGGSVITLTANYGMTVSLGSGSSMTGFDLYSGILSLRNDYGSGAITTDHLALADNGIPFNCLGGSNPVPLYDVLGGKLILKNICGDPDAGLRIESGATFRPGSDVHVYGTITINGAFDMESNPVSVSGSWLTNGNGSFTGTNLVWFNAESDDVSVRSNGSSFYDLQLGTPTSSPLKGITLLDNLSLSGSLLTGSGGFMLDDDGHRVRVLGNVSLHNNFITMGSGSVWIVSGDWTDTDTTTFISAGVTLSGSSLIILDGNETSILHNAAFANLTISGSIHMLTGAFITQTLTIATGATLSIDTSDIHQGLTIYSEGEYDADLRLLGNDSLITGPGILHIVSGSSISLNRGIIAPTIFHVSGQHVGTGNRIASGRYYSLISSFEPGLPSMDSTVEFDSGVYSFSGAIGLGGDADVYTVHSDPSTQFVFLGGLYLTDPSTLVFNQGNYPLVFSGSMDAVFGPGGQALQHIELSKQNASLTLVSSGSLHNMVVSHGTFDQNGQSLSITGTLVLSGGTFNVHGGTLTLSGDLMNVGGTVTDTTGSVVLNGASQKLFGNNTFYNLTKIASSSGQYLVMSGSSTQTINGTLRLQGMSGHTLGIISAASSYTNLTSGGSQIVDHVNVMNNIASGQQIVCYTASEGCVDSGNNVNWLFEPIVSSSSSSSASSQTPGGRRDETIEHQIEEITGTSANLLLSYPPDPPPGCDVKLMEANLGSTIFFLSFEGNFVQRVEGTVLPSTIDVQATPGRYISGIYYAGIQSHKSSVRVLDANGNVAGYYSFDATHDGDNYARHITYNTESIRTLRWMQGSEHIQAQYLAAYSCPLNLHDAPPIGPVVPDENFTVPEFPITNPITLVPPVLIPGLEPGDFIIDENGNIISVDGQFLIDRNGNLLQYDDLLRSLSGSLLLQQMRTLHFAALLKQGGLTSFYKPLTAEQLALLQRLLKRPLVSIAESDFLPNPILTPLIENVMRDPTEEHWNLLTEALTPDVVDAKQPPSTVSILSDAMRRGMRELASFTRTAGKQIVDYVLRRKDTASKAAITALPYYESALRPAGTTSELAVFHLRLVSAYGEPLAGVPVVLFSIPKFVTTDQEGVATFFDVPVGVHRLEAHLDDGRIETRTVTIRPPTNVRLTEPVETILPLADVVVPEPNDLRTDPDLFPPLALLLLAMIIGGNVYVQVRRRRQAKKNVDEATSGGPNPPLPPQTGVGAAVAPSL